MMLNAAAEWYKQLRHSYGFGIHSPSAYRLIREVLNPSPRYGYYAYATLRHMASKRHSRRELCLLYRILVDCQPESVAIVGEVDESVKEIVNIALPNAQMVHATDCPDFIIVGESCRHTDSSRMKLCAKPTTHIYFCDGQSSLLKECIAKMNAGHIFRNSRRALIVNRANLPLQIFNLIF